MTDSWVTDRSATASSSLLSPTVTPTRRASRNLGITNEVEHTAFVRTADAASPALQPGHYALGDTVVLSPNTASRQKWLRPPPYLVEAAVAGKGKGKGNPKPKFRREPREGYHGWTHTDGLDAREKVGIIVGLFDDTAKERKMARVRWLARPGAVWEEDGPEGEDEAEPEPFELYYTADSAYVEEAQAHRMWKSSPSTSLSRPALKASLCTDIILASHILRHVRVVASSKQRPANTTEEVFVVRKVYDVKPASPDDDFWGDIPWAKVLAKGKERNVWDTDPIGDGKPINTPSKKKDVKGKGKAVAVLRFEMEAEESSDDDNAAEAADFVRPLSRRQK